MPLNAMQSAIRPLLMWMCLLDGPCQSFVTGSFRFSTCLELHPGVAHTDSFSVFFLSLGIPQFIIVALVAFFQP